ncbi:MAG: Holliday junction branch migration protein RuvA [bacterium]|nr:Holliday junction branch migration protein RuvA [bacterium]
MIGSLRGSILSVGEHALLLEVAGIGYTVTAPSRLLAAATVGQEAFYFIHDHLREDAHDLYGFASEDDLNLFERLLSVSGVGPKVALAVASIGTADVVRKAIMGGDITRMTSVPGVGKKTAQKIILELKGQLVDADGTDGEDGDTIEALKTLGYSASQARDALKGVSQDMTETSARVREALRRLAKK